MLAQGGYQPFDAKGWWFEPKFDGVRTLLYIEGESVRALAIFWYVVAALAVFVLLTQLTPSL